MATSYWPATSADLAAWVQAAGTILAIAGAAGVAFGQHWLAQRSRRKTDLNAQIGQIAAVITSVMRAQQALEEFGAENEPTRTLSSAQKATALESARFAVRTLASQQMLPAALPILFETDSLLGQVLSASDSVESYVLSTPALARASARRAAALVSIAESVEKQLEQMRA